MGKRVASRETIRIELEDDFWIVAKKELTFGERKAIRKPFIRYDLAGIPQLGDDMEDAKTALIERAVVDWNVEDSDGNKLPINKQIIESLRDEDASSILLALNKLYTEVDEEAKKA